MATVVATDTIEPQICESVRYLGSEVALECLAADAYWPKWDAPWWHMLLLHEMGKASLIPSVAIKGLIETLRHYPVKIFPINAGEMPEGVDPHRGSPCHCQLGNVYQVLSAAGVNVDKELPWIRPWFLRYQMADGGLTCDETAYLVADECPSSMVGTIAVFEAILFCTPRPWTADEVAFLSASAGFLTGRKLKNGSESRHNAVERERSRQWMQLCFPRFYFYDVLRGLHALTMWAERTNAKLCIDAIADVVQHLASRFPDGAVCIERRSYDGVGTIVRSPSGEWIKPRPRPPATVFPLQEKVSVIGATSPFLSRQWATTRESLRRLGYDVSRKHAVSAG